MGKREKHFPEAVAKAIEEGNLARIKEYGSNGGTKTAENNRTRTEIKDIQAEILEIESKLNDIDGNIEVSADGDVIPRSDDKAEETQYYTNQSKEKVRTIDERSLKLH
jgi:hypothetical protein